MLSRGIGVGGVRLWLTANRQALAFHGSIANRPWRWFFERIRGLLRGTPPSGSSREEPMVPADCTPEQQALLDRVNRIDWYHSIDLGHGVVTRGTFDHRSYLERYGLPADLRGQRVLDVGTWDGFWAFEFERRGADVVAVDIPYRKDVDLTPHTRARLEHDLTDEWKMEPTGKGFALVKAALGSRVRREALSVYDLTPDRLGSFDVAHVGDLLIHLKNPGTALERVLSVTRGFAMISETYHPDLDHRGGECLMDYMSGRQDTVWWRFGLTALRQIIVDAGFRDVRLERTFQLHMRDDRRPLHHAVFRAYP